MHNLTPMEQIIQMQQSTRINSGFLNRMVNKISSGLIKVSSRVSKTIRPLKATIQTTRTNFSQTWSRLANLLSLQQRREEENLSAKGTTKTRAQIFTIRTTKENVVSFKAIKGRRCPESNQTSGFSLRLCWRVQGYNLSKTSKQLATTWIQCCTWICSEIRVVSILGQWGLTSKWEAELEVRLEDPTNLAIMETQIWKNLRQMQAWTQIVIFYGTSSYDLTCLVGWLKCDTTSPHAS